MHTKMFILLKCVTSAEMGPQGGKAMNNVCTDVLTRFGKPYLHSRNASMGKKVP
jgi:hypothetical protein